MKDTLILYRDWWDVIRSLPEERQLEVFTAICSYAFDNVTPKDPVILAVTALMRVAIDRDNTKWEEVRKKRAEAGRIGGLKPKANASTLKQKKQMQANAYNEENQFAKNACVKANEANACNEENSEYQCDTARRKKAKKQMQANQAVNVYNNISSFTLNTRTREDFYKDLQASEMFWEESAMALHCTIERLKLLLPDFHSEIKATEVTHNDFSDYRRHFFAWARKALNFEKSTDNKNNIKIQNNGQPPQDKYSKRRGADSSARSTDDYSETF